VTFLPTLSSRDESFLRDERHCFFVSPTPFKGPMISHSLVRLIVFPCLFFALAFVAHSSIALLFSLSPESDIARSVPNPGAGFQVAAISRAAVRADGIALLLERK
jgi:hypothetical protein